jgi:hypothetical protein
MFSRLFEVLSHEQNRVITVVGISDPPPPPPAPPVQIQPVNDTKPPVSDPPVVTTPTPPAPPPPPTPAFRQSLVLPSASILKASGEMEFRPVGKAKVAAILFRKELKGDIAKVQLLSPDGTTVLSEGKNAGLSTEGKPAWRFADVGEKYPPGAIVLVTLKDGSQRYIEIPNPSKTYNY